MFIFAIILTIVNIICLIINLKHKASVKNEEQEISYKNSLANKNFKHEEEIRQLRLQELQNMYDDLNNRYECLNTHYESYKATLNDSYDRVQQKFADKINEKDIALQNKKNEIDIAIDEKNKEISNISNELEKIRQTKIAVIEAERKEQIIKDNLSQYCLLLSSADKNDLQTLERIKTQLNNPRILNMLIWQTYYKSALNTLCTKILGLKDVTGIYKITNQVNNKCYIGQAVKIADRWKTHAKHGCGIDTPATNKLYKEMQEYGLYSFSWELLEECPQEQLNEKERYYIDLYQSDKIGLNSKAGNK